MNRSHHHSHEGVHHKESFSKTSKPLRIFFCKRRQQLIGTRRKALITADIVIGIAALYLAKEDAPSAILGNQAGTGVTFWH